MRYFRAIVVVVLIIFLVRTSPSQAAIEPRFWEVQSIDTMKYSRDLAREKLNDPGFDKTIDQQVKNIANTGATHIAIATPYDPEFLPLLSRWVEKARKYHLKVWFRGNWSGWEGWFEYPKITRAQHIAKTEQFILSHSELFADGDIFSACPECENGGQGDPRHTGDVAGYRQFLISEYKATQQAFSTLNKNVSSNYYSMNGDVAKLIMNKDTTTALDGVVVIDHYVASPTQLVNDAKQLAESSGGKIVLGEFGAPIPDIHGSMTASQQADWLDKALSLLATEPSVIGLNYWTGVGSSTELWSGDGKATTAVDVITNYYSPKVVNLKVINELKLPIFEGYVDYLNRKHPLINSGAIPLPFLSKDSQAVVVSSRYETKTFNLNDITLTGTVTLQKLEEDFWFKLLKWLTNPGRTSFKYLFHS